MNNQKTPGKYSLLFVLIILFQQTCLAFGHNQNMFISRLCLTRKHSFSNTYTSTLKHTQTVKHIFPQKHRHTPKDT